MLKLRIQKEMTERHSTQGAGDDLSTSFLSKLVWVAQHMGCSSAIKISWQIQ